MRGDEDRAALALQVAQDRQDRVARAVLQPAGRLVGQQQLWLVHQCPGDGHPLHVAPVELVREGIGVRPQAHLLDQRRHALRVAPPGEDERQLDVLRTVSVGIR